MRCSFFNIGVNNHTFSFSSIAPIGGLFNTFTRTITNNDAAGTVPLYYGASFGYNPQTLNSQNAQTYTEVASLYIGPIVQGTNSTITNNYALICGGGVKTGLITASGNITTTANISSTGGAGTVSAVNGSFTNVVATTLTGITGINSTAGVIFGSGLSSVLQPADITNTTTTLASMITGTTTNVNGTISAGVFTSNALAAGTYLVKLSFQYSSTATNRGLRATFLVDGAAVNGSQDYYATPADGFHAYFFEKPITFTAATHTFQPQFAVVGGAGTVTANNLYMALYRMS
jgi:hypothetical protein